MTAPVILFDIARRGDRWAVIDNGQVLRSYSDRTIAKVGALELENARQRQLRGARRRACLCCGRPFDSEGNQNRLCNPCRDRARRMRPSWTPSDGRTDSANAARNRLTFRDFWLRR
jgi:tRNA(Ile2) C34 agmatinyltransferase TiaS